MKNGICYNACADTHNSCGHLLPRDWAGHTFTESHACTESAGCVWFCGGQSCCLFWLLPRCSMRLSLADQDCCSCRHAQLLQRRAAADSRAEGICTEACGRAEGAGRAVAGRAGERGGAALGVAAAGGGGCSPAGQRALLHLLSGEANDRSKAVKSYKGLTCAPACS